MNAASFGTVLINDKKGGFNAIDHIASGFFEKGQIRDLQEIEINGVKHIIVLKNSDKASVYKLGF